MSYAFHMAFLPAGSLFEAYAKADGMAKALLDEKAAAALLKKNPAALPGSRRPALRAPDPRRGRPPPGGLALPCLHDPLHLLAGAQPAGRIRAGRPIPAPR